MSDSGSEDGSWEIEKYRVDYESDEHWELRKVSSFNSENLLIINFLLLSRLSWKLIVISSLRMRSFVLHESSQTSNFLGVVTTTK